METEQMPGMTPQPKGAVMRVHTVAVIAACVILIVVAFIAGMLVATNGYRPSADEVTDEEQQNEGEVTDDEVATDEVIVVDWESDEQGQEHVFNFYLRQWWEEGHVNSDAPEGRPGYAYTASVIDTIEGGAFDGYYLVEEQVEALYGIGGFNAHYFVLEPPKSDYGAVVLTRYSYSDTWRFDEPADLDMTIPGLQISDMKLAGHIDIVDTLTSTDGAVTFHMLGTQHMEEAPGYDLAVTTVGGVTLYESKDEPLDGVFYFVQPDGGVVWYDADVPFWQASVDSNLATPAIVWNDGDAAGEYMKGSIGGCGFVNPVNLVDERALPELVVTGYATADADIAIYEPADYADVADGQEYGNWQNYMRWSGSEGADTSITAFAAEHPTFYYHDALGRWMLFMTAHSASAAECGKPVIYLYPTTTTNIDVSLAPQGGFTKSEPAYNGGWHVTAQPDGTLTNLGDGKIYPYLFWEGRGGMYSAPEKYWVVAQADVHTFLTTTLAKLGLNAKETADFMEFWEPRMQGAPYYKIGFHGTSVMNQIAPMTLSHTPDTVLRVLMDYSELSTPIPANPPKLPPTPLLRNGFTVIEWGGVIR